jgi:hypothetical protein
MEGLICDSLGAMDVLATTLQRRQMAISNGGD